MSEKKKSDLLSAFSEAVRPTTAAGARTPRASAPRRAAEARPEAAGVEALDRSLSMFLDFRGRLLERDRLFAARLGSVNGADRFQLFEILEHGLVLADVENDSDAVAVGVDEKTLRFGGRGWKSPRPILLACRTAGNRRRSSSDKAHRRRLAASKKGALGGATTGRECYELLARVLAWMITRRPGVMAI
jgi:hypothetical protein